MQIYRQKLKKNLFFDQKLKYIYNYEEIEAVLSYFIDLFLNNLN